MPGLLEDLIVYVFKLYVGVSVTDGASCKQGSTLSFDCLTLGTTYWLIIEKRLKPAQLRPSQAWAGWTDGW